MPPILSKIKRGHTLNLNIPVSEQQHKNKNKNKDENIIFNNSMNSKIENKNSKVANTIELNEIDSSILNSMVFQYLDADMDVSLSLRMSTSGIKYEKQDKTCKILNHIDLSRINTEFFMCFKHIYIKDNYI